MTSYLLNQHPLTSNLLRKGLQMRCDKCKREVPTTNDVNVLEGLLQNGTVALGGSRHLLPVVEDGKTVCVGSPSRAQ